MSATRRDRLAWLEQQGLGDTTEAALLRFQDELAEIFEPLLRGALRHWPPLTIGACAYLLAVTV